MAQNNDANDIILNVTVKYEDAIKKIAELKVKNEELKKAEKENLDTLKSAGAGRQAYNEVIAATKAQMDNNNKAIQALNKEIQNNMKIENEQSGSINQLQASLSKMTAEYNNLSEAERKATEGADLQKSIADTTAKLKEEEEALGNHRRSVGDYKFVSLQSETAVEKFCMDITML